LNVNVAPAYGFAYSGAESFCNRLLAREPRSQMTLREFHRQRVFNFAGCENAMKKAISESVEGMLDALTFDNIYSDTYHAHLKKTVGRLTRSRPLTRSNDLPVDVARVTAAPFCETPDLGV